MSTIEDKFTVRKVDNFAGGNGSGDWIVVDRHSAEAQGEPMPYAEATTRCDQLNEEAANEPAASEGAAAA